MGQKYCQDFELLKQIIPVNLEINAIRDVIEESRYYENWLIYSKDMTKKRKK